MDVSREIQKANLRSAFHFRFGVTTALMAVVIFAIAFGWSLDRVQLQRQLRERDYRLVLEALDFANVNKQHQWRVSDHLSSDTMSIERKLASQLTMPTGQVKPSHGWGGTYQLRDPTRETCRKVIALLDSTDPVVQRHAAELLALYGEAHYSGTSNATDEFRTLADEAVPRLEVLIISPNVDTRSAAALALGQIASRRDGLPILIRAAAANKEDDATRVPIAWAIQKLFYSR